MSVVSSSLPAGVWAAVLAIPAVLSSARAEDGDASRGTVLSTVIVVGVAPLPGGEVHRNQIPAPVQTATAQDIERSHALDLTAFMNRTLGSVYINDIQNNSLQPDVNYRGYTASPLLGTPQGMSVYSDGVRLNQPFGDVVSWDLIPRAAIETMALMPGANPVFGLNALGGALTLRTKDGFSYPGNAFALNYGSDARRQAEVEIGGHADSGLHWYGTANQLKDDGWRDDSPTDASQVFGKVGWHTDASAVALSAAYADTDLNGNGLQEQRLLARDYASVYTKPDNTRNEAYLVNLVATHRVSDTVVLSANAHYRNIETHTFNGDINEESLGESLYQPNAVEQLALTAAGYTGFPTSGETQANAPFPSWRCIANILLNDEPNEKCNGLINQTHSRQHDGGLSVQASFSSPLIGKANQLVVGAAQINSHAVFTQSSRFGFLTPDRGIATADGEGAFADGLQDSADAYDARVDLTGDSRTRSFYFSDTLQLLRSVQLTLAGRYDHTTIDSVDGITPAGEPGTLTASHRFSRFNPSMGLTVSPSEALGAYVGFAQGSRAPSAIELGCADPENPCRLPNAMAGDPPLAQVVTQTFEAGMRGRFGADIAWNIGVFRADNRDDIMFVAADSTGFGYFKNFGKTRRQGAELGISSRLGPVSAGANYTLLDATYRSGEEVLGAGNSTNADGAGFEGTINVEPGDRIPLTPRHLFKAFAEWRIAPQFSTTVDLMSVSSAYARGNENNEHQPDGVFYLGSGKTGGYTVVNLGAEYRPLPTLKVFAQVNNVFDREYYTGAQLGATGFDAAGNFVARPFAGPIVDGERPLLGSTFFAPGAPRLYWFGVRYSFSGR